MEKLNIALNRVYYLAQTQDVGTVKDKVDSFNSDLMIIGGALMGTAIIVGIFVGAVAAASGQGLSKMVKIVLGIIFGAFLLGVGTALVGWFTGIGQGYGS